MGDDETSVLGAFDDNGAAIHTMPLRRIGGNEKGSMSSGLPIFDEIFRRG